MAFQSRGFALDLMALPTRSAELGVVFAQGAGNNGRPLLLLFPEQGPGLMPQPAFELQLSNVVGNLADSGQLQFGASLGELMQSFR